MTRVNADRATAELANRHATNPPTDTPTTGQEWLAHQAAAMRTEDPHRDIYDEHELADAIPPLRGQPRHAPPRPRSRDTRARHPRPRRRRTAATR